MIYSNVEWQDLSIKASLSTFIGGRSVTEHHAIFEVVDKLLTANEQFINIEKSIDRLHQSNTLNNTVIAFKRYFVSDATNQINYLNISDIKSATSIVQQAPLNGTKVSAWVYFVADSKVEKDENDTFILKRNNFKHLFNTQLHQVINNEYIQTKQIFEDYKKSLAIHHCNLKDNCIRTWIYVQGVDLHYADMVKARIEIFNQENLTEKTHYIASTGIEGKHTHPHTIVLMDAYAIKGIEQSQIKYLHAPTHLNRTSEYGVTFERGTSVDYSDRRHIFISGTASIDNKGEIVHEGDVYNQMKRAIENVITLLKEADAKMQDVASMIIYLRDVADYTIVEQHFNEQYPHIPHVIVLAPVCRPGWLFEMECIAIKSINKVNLKDF